MSLSLYESIVSLDECLKPDDIEEYFSIQLNYFTGRKNAALVTQCHTLTFSSEYNTRISADADGELTFFIFARLAGTEGVFAYRAKKSTATA